MCPRWRPQVATLTMAQAAMRCGLGYAAMRHLVFTGRVRAHQTATGRWRIDEGSLRAWIRSRQRAARQREGAESAA